MISSVPADNTRMCEAHRRGAQAQAGTPVMRFRFIRATVIFMLLFLVCSCPVERGEQNDNEITILTWNVQNLMDGTAVGTEYDEYGPSSHWDDAAYRRRLEDMQAVLLSRTLPDADILILQEVENAGVVSDLISGALARRGYRWYAVAGEEGGAIRTALISRLKPVRVTVQGPDGLRPALEAVFSIPGGTLVVWAVHAKSRKEGGLETEQARCELAGLIAARAGFWRSADPDCLLVVAGDMNEGPGEPPGDESMYRTALVRASSSHAKEWSMEGSLTVSGVPGEPEGSWYSPWLDESLPAPVRQGSCMYDGVWHQYDQILVSGLGPGDGSGCKLEGFSCDAPSSSIAATGAPLSWNVRLRRGISDHFPVWCTLRFFSHVKNK